MNVFQLLRKEKPVDELALAKLRERGAHAARLLRDETLAEAFTRVRQLHMQVWHGSGPLDVEIREREFIAVNLLDDLKAQIMTFVAEGEAASAQLARDIERKRAPAK